MLVAKLVNLLQVYDQASERRHLDSHQVQSAWNDLVKFVGELRVIVLAGNMDGSWRADEAAAALTIFNSHMILRAGPR